MNELIVDSFAGGGGASLGISWALGRGPDEELELKGVKPFSNGSEVAVLR